MAVHIGKVLREYYLESGKDMQTFSSKVNFAPGTVYYHFQQQDLNTSIIRAYQSGLRSLGIEVDLWAVIARKDRGVAEEHPAMTMVAEASVQYGRAYPSEREVMGLAAAKLAEVAELLKGRAGLGSCPPDDAGGSGQAEP